MNKKFTKLIAALALLVFMMPSLTGWGQSITITSSSVTDFPSGSAITYGCYHWTNNDISGTINCAKGNQSGTEVLQFNYSASGTDANGRKYEHVANTVAVPGRIVSITMTTYSGSRSWVAYVGTSALTTSNYSTIGTSLGSQSITTSGGTWTTNDQSNYNYFYLEYKTGSACYISSIEITYEIPSGPIVTGLSYTGTPTTTTYAAGDRFESTGLTVTATYSDNTQVDVTSSVVWTPDPLTQGTTSVIGSFGGYSINVNGLTVTAPVNPNIVLSKDNSPFTSTSSSNTSTETVTLDDIEYQNFAGYVFSSNYLSFNRNQEGGYLGNNTELCGNIKRIVVSCTANVFSYLTMYEGDEALAETTVITPTISGNTATYYFSGNSGYFKYKLTTTGTYCNINSISIYLKDCDNPAITVSPSSLSFTYSYGTSQNNLPIDNITVNGSNLTQNITVALPSESDFELSYDLTNWGNSTTLTPANGSLANAEVAVRLKEGKAVGTYTGSLSVNSNEVNEVTVSLSGIVTAPTHQLELYGSNLNGTITFTPSSPIPEGETVTLTATPNEGYDFGGWTFYKEGDEDFEEDNNITVNANNQFTMPQYDLWVDATFTAKPNHNVTIASGIENGTVTANPTSAYAGQTITLTVTPETNCYLSSLAATYVDENQETHNLTLTNNTFEMPNYDVTVTATFLSNTYEGSFKVYSGTLTEGDYMLVYDNKAINNVVTSKKLGYESVVPSQNNIITNPSKDVVWHVAASETTSGYWTIYNTKTEKYIYASSSSTDVNLVEGTTAASKWGVEGTYDFRTQGNESQSSKRYLRYNSASDVFGNYTTSYGGSLTLYKLAPASAPVWSELSAQTILAGEQYEITLSDYVTGIPVPTITLTSAVDGNDAAINPDLYECEDGILMFATNDVGTYTFTFNATNTEGSATATLTITVIHPILTVSALNEHINAIYVFNATNQNNPLIAEGLAGTVSVASGTDIIVSPDVEDGYMLESLTVVDDEGESVQPENHMIDGGYYSFTMPSGNVTISATAVVAPAPGDWVLTNFADLTPADVFVIVGNGNYAMANDGTSNPVAVAVIVSGNTLSGTIADNIQWNISGNDTYGYTFYPAGSSSTWLYCNTTASSSSNTNMRVGTGGTNNRSKFEFDENNQLSTKDNYTKRYLALNGSSDWRGYVSASTNTTTITFYKKISEDITIEKTITGHGGELGGGWNFIASPVASVTPSNGNGFITDDLGDEATEETATYDLYYFDQTADLEWKNYRKTAFNLVRGQGYLYANQSTVTLTFTGQPYNGNGLVPLTYDADKDFAGWNLVGNPFPSNATIDRPFFILEGRNLKASTSTTIAPCTGVMVQAAAVNVTQIPYTVDYNNIATSVTFTKETSNPVQPNQLQMTVAQQVVNRDGVSAETVDNAIVSFNEGNYLEKFVFNSDLAKLYIPQGGMDFAIVSNEGQGNLPVNFKATEDGTYTITVNPEGVEMNYLHLIDNMTGNDVDLLQTPSYSFNATTNDYESRFRLVFAAANNEDGASTGSASFAFMSDGNWIINNAGEATLQVIDLNGRILSSERVNGSVSKTINATPGVYMLRLINGENVMVQKIVVR